MTSLRVSVAQSTRTCCTLALVGSLAAACDPDVHLGTLPDTGSGGASSGGSAGAVSAGAGQAGKENVIWRSDFEVGDLSEWTADGQGGSFRSSEPSLPMVVSERAHSGTRALKLTITVANGMTSVNYMYRQAPTPTEAYYSAWFFIPKNYAITDWLNVVHFVGSQTGDGRDEVALWDLDLRSAADGTLALYAYEFEHSKQYDPPSPRPFAIGVWVELEILFRKASDTSGRVAVYQDGSLLLDLTGVRTAPNDWLRWSLGSASGNIVPAPAELYVDDATVSLSRVGQ